MDSKHWTPEVPERIGLYHAYIRGFNRDVRTHRLFIACSGGMARASDAFCNLVIDVGKHWTANDVYESEEAWWLRKGCQRARGRLIKMLADAFEVKLNHIQVRFITRAERPAQSSRRNSAWGSSSHSLRACVLVVRQIPKYAKAVPSGSPYS